MLGLADVEDAANTEDFRVLGVCARAPVRVCVRLRACIWVRVCSAVGLPPSRCDRRSLAEYSQAVRLSVRWVRRDRAAKGGGRVRRRRDHALP